MIQVTNDNKVIIEGDDIVAEATRISMLLLEITKKLNEKDPKTALSFLRVCHSMCNGLAKPIVDKMDEEADKRLQDKIAAKKAKRAKKAWKNYKVEGADQTDGEAVSSEVITKGEELDGDTEQSDTTSGNATDSGEFDSIRSDKSAAGSSSDNS